MAATGSPSAEIAIGRGKAAAAAPRPGVTVGHPSAEPDQSTGGAAGATADGLSAPLPSGAGPAVAPSSSAVAAAPGGMRRAGEPVSGAAPVGPDSNPGPAAGAVAGEAMPDLAGLSLVVPATHPAASAPSGAVAGAAETARAAAPPVPLAHLPLEIGLRSLGGASRFDITLTPDDLGRVDVTLDIDREGRVKAHVTVDRPETLAFLQRDVGSLERAFEQAGLKSQDGGVALSLRDGNAGTDGRGAGSGQPGGGRTATPTNPDGRTSAASAAADLPLRRYLAARAGRVDLSI